MTGERYNPREAEPRWQAVWEENRLLAGKTKGSGNQPTYHGLEMPPCPPGSVHSARMRHLTMIDVVARYKRANGHEVQQGTFGGKELGCLPASVPDLPDVGNKPAGYTLAEGADEPDSSIESTSTSSCNAISPHEIIELYGADTARWFMVSDSPRDRNIEWTDTGAEAAHRFVQRIWRLVDTWSTHRSPSGLPGAEPFGNNRIRKAAHKTLRAIGDDIERLAFNRSVARIREFVNVLSSQKPDCADEATCSAIREGLGILVVCFAPMMPHLAEECWSRLGQKGLVTNQSWPQYLSTLTTDDIIVMPVHVNGKKCADIEVDPNANKEEIEAASLSLDVVQNYLDGSQPKKLIVVPKRIVNVVT